MIRYLISDGTAALDRTAWLANIADWMVRGVDFVQIRESGLNPRELSELTRSVLRLPRHHQTKILINDRVDVAIACGADGVHLKDRSLAAVRLLPFHLFVTVACHDLSRIGETRGADLILLSPIFDPISKSPVSMPLGTEAIREASGLTSIPILALGGITSSNDFKCVEAGAAGIAGIDYFRPFVQP